MSVPQPEEGGAAAFVDLEATDDQVIDQTVREMDFEALVCEEDSAPTGDFEDDGENDMDEDFGDE